MKLKVGSIIIGIGSHNRDIVREIVEVRKTGYTWKYENSVNDYWSENSNDPFFEFDWKLKLKPTEKRK